MKFVHRDGASNVEGHVVRELCKLWVYVKPKVHASIRKEIAYLNRFKLLSRYDTEQTSFGKL